MATISQNLRRVVIAAIGGIVLNTAARAQEVQPQAQQQETTPQEVQPQEGLGQKTLLAYQKKRVDDLPWIKYQQVLKNTKDRSTELTLLRAVDLSGWSIEGAGRFEYQHVQQYPVWGGGLGIRYDAHRTAMRISGYLGTQEYNGEAIEPGKRYYSYSSELALYYYLWDGGPRHKHIVSVYGTVGYAFDRHNVRVNDLDEDGAIAPHVEIVAGPDGSEEPVELIKWVKHNGSGLTFGGGLEWKTNFGWNGHAVGFRVGYNTLTNAYINDTKINGMINATAFIAFGFNRHRVDNRAKFNLK